MALVSEPEITTVDGIVFYYYSALSNIMVIAAEGYEVNTVFHVTPYVVANRQRHYRHATYGEKDGILITAGYD